MSSPYTNGQELLKQRCESRCLGCGDRWPSLDRETGFPEFYCMHCKAQKRDVPPKAPRFDHKAERQRGIENLDRLLGAE